ncbi:MAG: cobyric acid synthase [Chloroflexi bacterium]|nr:cobyric acid synthase [Chloroflexota bacterium]
MRGSVLMIQGTMSSVGKSLLVAALCRIFKQDGLRVAPFKAQNMALNSFATRDGREIGRAQAMQADAAGVDVTVEMNPVLIKPEADSFAQIVVMGKPWARLPAGQYMRRRGELWTIVTRALDSLRAQSDVVVIEGAGSPVELNLRRGDLVNMAIAEYADAPVLLVGDIDRGGIFAQLLGTHALLEGSERARVKGFIANKFRGDARLFVDGVKILEECSGVPVIGVMPFVRDLRIADEDSVALETLTADRRPLTAALEIVVIRLPHISNFDDFDPLRAEADVTVRFVDRADDLGEPDLIILPGTKTTIADLKFLRERGLAARIVELARTGTPILGICGGYQMLGAQIRDPQRVESDETQVAGLGLLPLVTTFEAEKQTVRARGVVTANDGLFANARGLEIAGYEIHMGQTRADCTSLVRVAARGENAADDYDGAVDARGWIAGTYFHGFFDNDALRGLILTNLAARKGIVRTTRTRFDRGAAYDLLAQVARENLNVEMIYRLLERRRINSTAQ